MSDEEFDLLDELYFVQPYSVIQEALAWEDGKMLDTLVLLKDKGWIKCFTAPDRECFDSINLHEVGKELLYLASKKGLMAHNTI